MERSIHTDVITNNGLPVGNMLGSKSVYRNLYPNNKILFNCNIITSNGKVWWGDLDITNSLETLKSIVKQIEEPLYILQEFACRWEFEEAPIEVLKSRAAYIITEDGYITEGKMFLGFTKEGEQFKLF